MVDFPSAAYDRWRTATPWDEEEDAPPVLIECPSCDWEAEYGDPDDAPDTCPECGFDDLDCTPIYDDRDFDD